MLITWLQGMLKQANFISSVSAKWCISFSAIQFDAWDMQHFIALFTTLMSTFNFNKVNRIAVNVKKSASLFWLSDGFVCVYCYFTYQHLWILSWTRAFLRLRCKKINFPAKKNVVNKNARVYIKIYLEWTKRCTEIVVIFLSKIFWIYFHSPLRHGVKTAWNDCNK